MSEPPDHPGGADPPTVLIEDEQDRPVDATRLRRVAETVLEALGVPSATLLDVTLVTPARIAHLKGEHLGEARPTDVLSFGVDDPWDPAPGPAILGDVVLCPAVAERQARALGCDPEEEYATLLIHGILHLAGWDHTDPASERAMAAEERRLLAAAEAAPEHTAVEGR